MQFEDIKNDEIILIDGTKIEICDVFEEKDFVFKDSNQAFIKHNPMLRATKKHFKILSKESKLYANPFKDNDWCACVKVRYTLKSPIKETIVVEGLADCKVTNSNKGFGNYTTAMAETRASARALRTILGIEFCSIEELDSGDSNNHSVDGPIEENQKALIENKFFRELNLTIKDFSDIVGVKINNVNELTKKQAAEAIEKLNAKKKELRKSKQESIT